MLPHVPIMCATCLGSLSYYEFWGTRGYRRRTITPAAYPGSMYFYFASLYSARHDMHSTGLQEAHKKQYLAAQHRSSPFGM